MILLIVVGTCGQWIIEKLAQKWVYACMYKYTVYVYKLENEKLF